MKLLKRIFEGAVLLVLLGAGAAAADKTGDKIVAEVNNDKVLLSEFERISKPLVDDYRKKNVDATTENITKFREQILDELVNNKLIVQQARKDKDIKVSQRNLDEQIKKIKEQFKSDEEFKEQLKEENLTEEQFVQKIKDQLAAEELTYREVQKKVPSKLTEEEIDRTFKLVKKRLVGEKIENLSDQDKQGIDTLSEVMNKYLMTLKAQEKYIEWTKKLRSQGKVNVNPLD